MSEIEKACGKMPVRSDFDKAKDYRSALRAWRDCSDNYWRGERIETKQEGKTGRTEIRQQEMTDRTAITGELPGPGGTIEQLSSDFIEWTKAFMGGGSAPAAAPQDQQNQNQTGGVMNWISANPLPAAGLALAALYLLGGRK